jgi:hypothetical protein
VQDQSIPWFQLFLVILGITLRTYAGRKRGYVDDISDGINSLKDKARNEMILVLGKLLRDIESQETEPSGSATDGGESAVAGDDDLTGNIAELIEMWDENETVKTKLWKAMIRVTRTLQRERAEEGKPEEMLIAELQDIRRDLQPGSDLEQAKKYKQRVERIEQILQWNLTVAVLLSGFVLLSLVLPGSVEVPVPGAVSSVLATYGPVVVVIILLFALVLALISRYYRSRVSELFSRNDIGGFL